MENLRKLKIKRTKQPRIESKNFIAGCSMCDRTFSVIVPAGVVPESPADRSLMSALENQFSTQ